MADPATTAKALLRRKGAVRSRELVEAGIARVQLSRLVAAGELVRLARGVYSAPGVVLRVPTKACWWSPSAFRMRVCVC